MMYVNTTNPVELKAKANRARSRVMTSKNGGYFYVPSKEYVERAKKQKSFIPPTKSTSSVVVTKITTREFLRDLQVDLEKQGDWTSISGWKPVINNSLAVAV